MGRRMLGLGIGLAWLRGGGLDLLGVERTDCTLARAEDCLILAMLLLCD